MRVWTTVVLLGVAASLFALDDTRLALLRQAALLHLPASWIGTLRIEPDDPATLERSAEQFLATALDLDCRPEQRLGAAELLVLGMIYAGDHLRGTEFEARFGRLLQAARTCPEEPAFCAVLIDVLRAHRELGIDQGETSPIETLLSHEAVRLARETDPGNGFGLLFAADVALFAGRLEEARDLLWTATRARRVDPYLRRRAASARAFLTTHGVPEVEAWGLLVHHAYGAGQVGHAELVDHLASGLGAGDVDLLDQESTQWMSTWLALHRAAMAIFRTALLVEDADAAAAAERAYLGQLVGSVFDLNITQTNALDNELKRRLAGEGFARAVGELEEDRREVGALRDASRVVGRRNAHTLAATAQAGERLRLHSLLVPWLLVCFGFAMLCGLLARWTRRPERARPVSIGLVFAAMAAPALLLTYLGVQGMLPIRGEGGGSWLNALIHPHPALYLFPLAALPVLWLPRLGGRESQHWGMALRSAARFFAGYGAVLLVLFAVSAPRLVRMAELRLRVLDVDCVETYLNRDAARG